MFASALTTSESATSFLYAFDSCVFAILFIFLGFIITSLNSFFASGGDLAVLTNDVTIFFRFLLIPVSFMYGKQIIQSYTSKEVNTLFKKIIIINFFVLSINLLMGFAGIGYKQYEDNIGSVGFFFAGNEVSAVMIILFCFIASYFYTHKSKKKYLILSLVFLTLAIIKATKVGIIGVSILLLLTPFLHARLTLSYKIKLKSLKVFFISLSLIVLIGYLLTSYIVSSDIFQRLEYFYSKADGIVTFLLSGRNQFVQIGWQKFKNLEFFNLLFGVGNNRALDFITGYYGAPKATEIDFFDFLFQFGFVGLFLVYGMHLYFFFLSFFSLLKRKSELAAPCFLSNLLILFISLTAGHVFNAGMATAFIGITNSMIFLKADNNNKYL